MHKYKKNKVKKQLKSVHFQQKNKKYFCIVAKNVFNF